MSTNWVEKTIGVVEPDSNIAHIVPMKFYCDPNNNFAPFFPDVFDWWNHKLQISYINPKTNNRVYKIIETLTDEEA